MTVEFTPDGLEKVERFIRECKAKRKEILDAGKDTADNTDLPTPEDIESDIISVGVDDDGDYYNSWGVTDNYDSDTPLVLTIVQDFIVHHHR